ncbi:MAG: DUF4230 domain-containing protein [Anaerolineae bacterium]|nr:DUF4230 domain-containing protein [Anaerolineae bacterium]
MRRELLIWGIIVLAIVLVVSVAACLVGTLIPWPAAARPTPTRTIVINIEEIRQQAELATVKYTLSTDITSTRVPDDIRKELGVKEEIVLIAYGEVAAGFDLSKLGPDDLWVDGTRVQLRLPAPEILYVRLDNERTHVVYYNKSWFIERDLGLEGAARLEAEEKMHQAALESGVLQQASGYGQIFFSNWFYSMGFTNVQVVVE